MLPAFKKNKWLSSLIVVALLFLLVNLFFFPLFNSGDDVYLMYTLGGGFEQAPSDLLHYDHIWNPVLGWIVKTLFTFFPSLNWYTAFLIFFQIAGCTAILYFLLNRFQWIIAVVLFFVLFVFVEARILLSLNFTSSSWVLATGGCVLLLHNSFNAKRSFDLFVACILLLLSGLLRLHILFLVIILFMPSFLMYAKKKYRIWAYPLLMVVVLTYILNIWHKEFYKKNIPGWRSEEKLRQSLFFASNRPLKINEQPGQVTGESTVEAFYHHYFFYDSNFISQEKVSQIARSSVRYRDLSSREDKQMLYWIFMELRVYILLFGIVFFLLWRQHYLKKVLKNWLISSILIFAMHAVLFLFFKLTESIHLGALLLLWIFLCIAIPAGKIQGGLKFRNSQYLTILLLLPFAWMTVRIIKKNNENRYNHKRFECVTGEIIKNKEKLFLATDNALPLDYFYIWDIPAKHKLTNLVYMNQVVNNCYQPAFRHFGITEPMEGIYENENVFLVGSAFPELKEYYKVKKNKEVIISSSLNDFKCLEVRKISLKN